ncbi:hypothetical protein [Schlesneria sp. T3-172]|uniref:hypothetical protein n=1 Tax=Schlesneria sphaerica TaxID=3373610 RepID=UPI0037CBBCCC
MNSKLQIVLAGCLGFLALLLPGCGTSPIPHTELFGEVSLDGKPVDEAVVYLSAKTGDSRMRGTYTAEVIDGEFEFPRDQGPPPGEYEIILKPIEDDSEELFVRIREQKRQALLQRDQFLAAVARKGTIRVSLSEDDTNQIKIDLTSR